MQQLPNLTLTYVSSGLGIGGIVVPASIITAIICPDELIATVTALTLSIRVLGGAIGYAVYYNLFAEHFKEKSIELIGKAAVINGITNKAVIAQSITLTSAGLLPAIRKLPGMTDKAYAAIVHAGQEAYAESYPWVYYVSIAFGGVSIICSLFLGNIKKYMTDHVAVRYEKQTESPTTASEEEVVRQ